MRTHKHHVLRAIVTATAVFCAGHAGAAPLNLASEPLLVASNVPPNILFLIDDSGSMSNIVPDTPFDAATKYFDCPASMTLAAGSTGRIDISVESGGTPFFLVGGTAYDWSVLDDAVDDTDINGRPERCFEATDSYAARLYGNGGAAGEVKFADGYAQGQYTGNYLNWYFGSTPTAWGTDARNKPGTERRIDIAKVAAKNLMGSLNDVRIGLASYNGSNGARIGVGIDDLTASHKSVLDTSIDALTPSGSTPLSESLHDIGRYFVGESAPMYDGLLALHPNSTTPVMLDDDVVFSHSPNYSPGVSKSSPIQYFCQKNFAVLLTDGRPQSDQDIAASTQLLDYDGDCPNGNDGTTCNDYDRKVGQVYESGGSDYLDDVAKALYEIDLRPDLDDLDGLEVTNNIVTYTIGFADDQVINDPLMQDTANNGGGLFLQAANASQLAAAFTAATQDIFGQLEATASSLAFNTGSVQTGSHVYQARFVSDDWTGQLLALALHDGSGNNGCSVSDPIGTPCPDPVWDASCTLTGGSCASTGQTIGSPNLGSPRDILTFNTDTNLGVALSWSALSPTQQAALDQTSAGVTDGNGQDRLSYLRGDRANEVANGGIFRDRESLLGDIVHAAPLYVGVPNRRYPGTWVDRLGGSTPENGSGVQTYSSFMSAYAQRMRMLYVGANDGLLHGFESGKFDTSGNLQSGTNRGKELLAYMPSKILAAANTLTDANYSHRYYIDGSSAENDVFFNADTQWHTVLVGNLGFGGQGLHALDISNPDDASAPGPTFDESNAANLVLWEFTDDDDADLGYTVGQPAIVRLHNGDWGVVVGNGLNNTESDGATSSTGNAVLFVLDVEDGSVLAKLDTGVGSAQDPTGQNRPNALAAVFPVDKDADLIIDYVYAGDLFGNVWRFDLTATSASSWLVSEFDSPGSPTPLFTATDANGNPQPITTQVQVAAHPGGLNHGVMVYFGTGKYLEGGDQIPNVNTVQSFYGIWDKDFFSVGASIDVLSSLATLKKSGFTRSTDLQQQQIDATDTAGSRLYRRVTNNAVNYASSTPQHGWYVDLKLASGPNEGEMVIADPVVRGEAVVFTTFIPLDDPCHVGGKGFLMVLNKTNGGRMTKSPFDVNNDGVFTVADYLDFSDGGDESASGVTVTGNRPGFVLSRNKDVALIPRLDGTVAHETLYLGIPVSGRKTWLQLR